MAYTMLDATGAVDARLSEKLSSIPCRHPGAHPVTAKIHETQKVKWPAVTSPFL